MRLQPAPDDARKLFSSLFGHFDHLSSGNTLNVLRWRYARTSQEC
jgi:hypothetical protein